MADDIRNCRDVDEHLTPYVDGEELPDARRSVETHLAACPPCREHADAEQQARELVRRNRGQLAARAPDSLRAACAAHRAMQAPRRFASAVRRWAPLSLAASVLLAVAGVFLFGLNDRVEALAASLTVDHVKCFKVGARAHADAADAARSWQEDQGWSIVVPQTTPAEELQLVDVRRCFSTSGRAAHMLYTWQGEPLSLYVLPEDEGRDRVVERMGHQTVIWCANRRTYAVVAEGHPQDLARIVDYMKEHAK